MSETMDYIFRRLKMSEVVWQNVARELRRQRCLGRNAAVIAGAAVYLAVTARVEQRKQADRIKKLEMEIEELTHPKESKQCDD